MTSATEPAVPNPHILEQKKVGEFIWQRVRYDGWVGGEGRETEELLGPNSFMVEQGNMLTNQILEGRDPIFNATSHFSPDPITAFLVRLQTAYAGWLGLKQFQASLASIPE